jgi:periplasmic protein TonB
MPLHAMTAADQVFSVHEVAQAAGVPEVAALELIHAGEIRTVSGYLIPADAIVCVRALRRMGGRHRHDLFEHNASSQRSPVAGAAGSGAFHLALVGVIALITALGLDQRQSKPIMRLEPARLVFLATPGPGGGGGGGGLKQPTPPSKAEMKSPAALVRSPVPRPKPLTTQRPERVRRPPPPPVVSRTKPIDPPPPAPRPALTPQVVAPVVSASTDPRDKAGVLSEATAEPESQGPGTGTGAGTGQGTGVGEGSGPGIGPGSGGGTGGGPYRPGAGITPPTLLHEVRPDYTEEARRAGIEGEVVLEIVVRHDGSVGDVKVLNGLRAGLDRRAIDAVRQWRFTPARRYGTPVDVIVEVAVEFKLR